MSFVTLSTLYWIHILATVAWLGSQAAILLWVLPFGKQYLSPEQQLPHLAHTLKQALPWQWLSATMLLATGMFQMSASPNYEGLLAITNRWAVAILLKHLAYGGMLGINAVLSLHTLPALQRAALLLSSGREVPHSETLQRTARRWLWLNLVLGVVVLGLTALARAA
ncbi:MAG: hypothetical protein D6755_02950 [Anaerolineae bacterium]|nr:MAG: hypothetical protein D6755_02950 [Anaerolineae bacterium]